MEHIGKLILRLAFGGLMLTHGYPKLMKLINADFQFPDPLGVGSTASLILTVFAEVICALLIVVGYKTKWASVPLVITMLVAAFIVHGSDPWGKKEFALLYGIGFLVIGMIGAGKYSVDYKTSKFQ